MIHDSQINCKPCSVPTPVHGNAWVTISLTFILFFTNYELKFAAYYVNLFTLLSVYLNNIADVCTATTSNRNMQSINCDLNVTRLYSFQIQSSVMDCLNCWSFGSGTLQCYTVLNKSLTNIAVELVHAARTSHDPQLNWPTLFEIVMTS